MRKLILFSILLGGCTIGASDDDAPVCEGGKCDGGPDRCEAEHAYGDGTCDTDCAQADTDCFLFFDDQAAAETWFGKVEAMVAQEEVRPVREMIATTDPRFQRMRTLLDRGWAAYRDVMPVGEIDRAPQLVVIDDPSANAFVARDQASGKAAWTVMVQTGALEGASDASVLGVVMHELTHATKLHILEGVPERTRIHYQIAAPDPEPIGSQQRDNARARAAITAWRALGEDAGAYAYAELNGLPAFGSLLSKVLNGALGKVDLAQCPTTVQNLQKLNGFIDAHTETLTNLLVLATPTDRTQLDQLTRAFLGELRTGCMKTSALDIFELMAEQFNVTPAEIAMKFPPTEQATVAGKHVIEQITLLASDRHRRMREVGALLYEETGRDITTLRYFSTEEDADDATVPVLRQMELPVDGVGQFFLELMDPALKSRCTALLAANTTPPYGDLVDEHHATCWRIAHVQQLGRLTAPAGNSAARRAVVDTAPVGDYAAIAGERLPRFPLASDNLSHAHR